MVYSQKSFYGEFCVLHFTCVFGMCLCLKFLEQNLNSSTYCIIIFVMTTGIGIGTWKLASADIFEF